MNAPWRLVSSVARRDILGAMVRLPYLLLAMTSVAGCYLDHERAGGVGTPDAASVADVGPGRDTSAADAAPACLAEGIYDTPFRVESSVPASCLEMSPSAVPVRIPPRVEDFAGMCPAPTGGVAPSGPCSWSVDVSCAIADSSTQLRGTIDTRGGVVHGRLDVVLGSLAGECRATIVLGG